MPVGGRGVLEPPVDRDPSRPPGPPVDGFGPENVGCRVEFVEILPSKNFPIAIQEGAAQMRRKCPQRLDVILVARLDRVVGHTGWNKIVIGRVVLIRLFHSAGGLLVDP